VNETTRAKGFGRGRACPAMRLWLGRNEESSFLVVVNSPKRARVRDKGKEGKGGGRRRQELEGRKSRTAGCWKQREIMRRRRKSQRFTFLVGRGRKKGTSPVERKVLRGRIYVESGRANSRAVRRQRVGGKSDIKDGPLPPGTAIREKKKHGKNLRIKRGKKKKTGEGGGGESGIGGPGLQKEISRKKRGNSPWKMSGFIILRIKKN